MVLVLGTSACHMMNSRIEQLAPGIADCMRDVLRPQVLPDDQGGGRVGVELDGLIELLQGLVEPSPIGQLDAARVVLVG